MQRDREKCAGVGGNPGTANANREPVTFRRGARIVQEGKEIRGVYCMIAGRVSLMKRGDDGQMYNAGTAVAGDMIGMPEIMNGGHFSATAVAERVTSASFIPKQEFLDLVRRNPSIVLQSIKRVCERIKELETKIEAVA